MPVEFSEENDVTVVTIKVPGGIGPQVFTIQPSSPPVMTISVPGIQGAPGPAGPQGPQGISGQPVAVIGPGQSRGGAAQPGLMFRSDSYRNVATNPRGVKTKTTSAEVRRNLVSPTAQLLPLQSDSNGVTRTTGVSFNSLTWIRLARTAAASGNNVVRTSVTLAELVNGATYTASYLVYNEGASPVTLTLDMADAGTRAWTIPATTTQRIWVTASKATYDAVYRFADLEMPAGVDSSILVREVLFERTAIVKPWFDGDTTDTAINTYAWTGTAGASSSTIVSAYTEARRNLVKNPSFELGPDWGYELGTGGAWTTARQTTGGINNGVHFRATATTAPTAGSTGAYVQNNIAQGGLNYTASAYIRVSKAVTIAPRIEWKAGDGSNISTTNGTTAAIPANTWTRVSMSTVAPLSVVKATLAFYAQVAGAGLIVGDTFDMDSVLFEHAPVPDTYFDGTTTDEGAYLYEWEGTANASESIAYALKSDLWGFNPESRTKYRWYPLPGGGVRLVSEIAAVNGTNQYAYLRPPAIGWPSVLQNAEQFTVVAKVRTSAPKVYFVNRSPGFVNQIFTVTPNQITTLYKTFTRGSANLTDLIEIGTETSVLADQLGLGGYLEILELSIVPGSYDGPAFDGDLGPGSWEGTPHESRSVLNAGSLSYWDGTNERWVNDEKSASRDYIDAQIATRAPLTHTHNIADINATGTRNDTTYLRGDGTWSVPAGGGGGVTAHSALTGLTNDDHTQYYNQTRGDARYTQIGHTHTATNITDSTTVGRAVLTAVDAAAARTAIGAVVIGTTGTTAAAGDHTHLAIGITDSTATGRSVLTAASAAAARTAIGAGTSDLVIGTTSTTAKAGNYQPTAANISDSTTVGRAVLTAVDGPAARTAIGAGSSNLNLGTTSTTAAAGDHNHDESMMDFLSTGLIAGNNIGLIYNDTSGTITINGPDPGLSSISLADLPPGSTHTVYKNPTTGWPVRPTSRVDIHIIWKGADPSPAIVSSGTAGMHDNSNGYGDSRFVTP
jgi:hypothetical protein